MPTTIEKSATLQENPKVKPSSNPSKNREKIAELITRLGHSAAIILLDYHYEFFMVPEIEGFIGYRLESNCAVVISDPVCTEKDISALTFAFHEFCKEKGWKVIYIIVSEAFRRWAVGKVCKASLEIGEEFVVDPFNDPTKCKKGEKVRYKVHKSAQAGVTVEEYTGNDSKLEEEIKAAGNKWLKARKGPQIYVSDVDVFLTRYGKRWFYAMQGNLIVGVLVINRLDRYNGYVLNMLMTIPDSPTGTSENLIMTVLDKLKSEGSHFFSIGIGTANSIGEMVGFNAISASIARNGFKLINWIFHLNDRKHFLQKFNPQANPTYVLFSDPKIGVRELMALKRTLNISLS